MKNKEYVNKNKALLDLILIYYIKYNFDFQVEDEFCQKIDKYFGIGNRYLYVDEKQLKEKIFESYNMILEAEDADSSNSVQEILPMRFLFRIFDFSFFQKICFLVTLFYMSEEKYRLIISCLDNNTRYGVCIDLVIKIYESLGLEPDYWFDDLKLNILGLDREINNNKSFSQKIMIVSDRVTAFVFDKYFIDSDIKDIINFYKNNNISDNNIKLIKNLDIYIDNLMNSDRSFENKKLNLLVIRGDKGSGKKTQILSVLSKYNIHIVFIDFEFLTNRNLEDIEIILKKLVIEAYLSGSLICIYNFKNTNITNTKFILLYLYKYFYFVILLSEDKFLDIDCFRDNRLLFNDFVVEALNTSERLDFWNIFMKDSDIKSDDIEKVASSFLFTIGDIKNIAEKYLLTRNIHSSYEENLKLLKKLCIENSNYNFGNLAFRVDYNFSWDDLILEEGCKSKLRSICNRVRYQDKIYNDWNFKSQMPYGMGISALFYGPPGTGKTMAAKVIANQIGRELYKIDLSQVVDKYIGETEKNLKYIFDKAQKANVILFFDEADSIFSKRFTVSSSNDRYSNIEISYLLQKIEEYPGVSILATNLLSGFDEAFKRRIRFIVNFNIPDKNNRYLIWKKSFPKEAKIDKNIDFLRLAEKFELSGSSIKSIAVSSAFYALEEQSRISIEHIKRALQDELEKDGKVFLSSDLYM